MKQGHPHPFCTEIPAEDRRHRSSAQQFHQQRCFDNEACQANDTADFGRRDGFLHGTALHQGYFAPGDHCKGRSNGNHAHTANLNQKQNHKLTKRGPIGCCIIKDKPGDAYCRSRCEQRVQQRRCTAILAGQRQHQQERAQQDHAEKPQDDDLERSQFLFGEHKHIHRQLLLSLFLQVFIILRTW